jgi:hypothetical protein
MASSCRAKQILRPDDQGRVVQHHAVLPDPLESTVLHDEQQVEIAECIGRAGAKEPRRRTPRTPGSLVAAPSTSCTAVRWRGWAARSIGKSISRDGKPAAARRWQVSLRHRPLGKLVSRARVELAT